MKLLISLLPVVLKPGSFGSKLNREIKSIKDKENRTIATDSLRIVILLTNFLNLSIEIIIL